MLDGIRKHQKKPLVLDYALAKFVLKHKNSSVLLSQKCGKVHNFTTGDSKLYLTQEEILKIRQGFEINFVTGRLDSIIPRREKSISYVFRRKKEDRLYLDLKERYSNFGAYIKDLFGGYTHGVSMTRAWNLSLVGSLIFGMFLMTMIYRYLGPGARADVEEARVQAEIVQLIEKQEAEKVLGDSIAKAEAEKKAEAEAVKKKAADAILAKQKEFEMKILDLVGDHPIKQMAPCIAKEDPLVAAMFIAIAKKESSWGDHVPVNNGKDCYNYVGFRLKTAKMGSGEHSCFATPQEGFERTAKRIKDLIYDEKMTTAKKMVSPWKCGYRPDLDDPKAVQKWVSDVDSILKEVHSWKIEGNR
jgi:hypothetical protein